jgi:hypothetical protein
MSDERRRSRRHPVKAPARVRVGGEELPGLLRDICREAALVESPRELELDTPVLLAIELPSQIGTLEVGGRVVRRAESEDGVHPLAILFSDVPPTAATQLDLFLAKLEQVG